MHRFIPTVLILSFTMFLMAAPEVETPKEAPPSSVEQARARALLLHDTFETTLHAIHHEYYREDENLTLPAALFRDVFEDLAKRHHVRLRWLAVEGQAMNVEHEAATDFEKEAVRVLASGQPELEKIEHGRYTRAGRITLTSECLKCHVPDRKSTADRAAGLIISIPLPK